jgi:hypothetical protein
MQDGFITVDLEISMERDNKVIARRSITTTSGQLLPIPNVGDTVQIEAGEIIYTGVVNNREYGYADIDEISEEGSRIVIVVSAKLND